MKRVIIKRVFMVVCFLLLLNLSIRVTRAFLDKTDVDEKYKQFFAEEDNIDVIFMGTSHMYNGIMPQEIWDKWKIPSYNWGQGSTSLAVSYYALQMLCEYTTPSLVVMDLYGIADFVGMGNGKYKADALDLQRVQFDPFPLSRLKIEAVNDVFDDYEKRSDFLFPLAIYHNRWTEIKKDNFAPRDIPQKGAAFVLGIKESSYVERDSDTLCEIPEVSLEYLEKLMDFCREKGIRMLFTYLPFVPQQRNIDMAYTLEKYFEQYSDCPYLNMLRLGIIDYSTDVFTDGSHLNYIGSSVMTEWLGGYIAENYPDTVHADDKEYEDWNDDYDKYVDYKISRFVDGDTYNNLQLVYGDDFTAVIEVNEKYTDKFYTDARAVNLINRLGDRISVETVTGDLPNAVLKVTDLRSSGVVFKTTIK